MRALISARRVDQATAVARCLRPLIGIALLTGSVLATAADHAGRTTAGEFEGIVDLLEPDYLARPINVARLPLRYAITVVHGRGERVLYTFEDPNCGYCRALNRQLGQIGNLTVHTFVLSLLGEESRLMADAVWCAKDRARAWQQVMQKNRVAPPRANCRAPTYKTMQLAEMLGVNLMPTVFYADGSRMNGVKPSAEIEARLRDAAKPR